MANGTDDDLCFSELEEYSDDSDLERMENMGDDGNDDDDVAAGPTGLAASASKAKVTGLKHLNEMKTLLGLDNFKEKKAKRKERKQRAKARKKAGKVSADGQRIIQTLATARLQSKSAPELIVYNDPRKRKKPDNSSSSSLVTTGLTTAESEEVSMKQARFDVFRFGLSGFGKEEKEDAETAQLVRLGAKPAKNKCLGYAEFKEVRKKEREEEAMAKEVKRKSGLLSTVSRKAGGGVRGKDKKKTKKKKGETIQSKVGTFDGGMLKLSAQDVAKIKASKK